MDQQFKRVGGSKAKGLPFLSMTCRTLNLAHAVNPKLTYEGREK
jgi:hypothetical protein